jgi:putative transposase
MPEYRVHRLNLGRTAQLDALAHAAGQVYTRTLVFFWRTVRKKRHLAQTQTPDEAPAC